MRARHLLLAWLSPAERDVFECYDLLRAVGSLTGFHYWITGQFSTYNIFCGDFGAYKNHVCYRLCLYAPVPFNDVLLVSKLALALDEEQALFQANVMPNNWHMRDTLAGFSDAIAAIENSPSA